MKAFWLELRKQADSSRKNPGHLNTVIGQLPQKRKGAPQGKGFCLDPRMMFSGSYASGYLCVSSGKVVISNNDSPYNVCVRIK